VKNKIKYRRGLLVKLQSTVRMWRCKHEYRPRWVSAVIKVCANKCLELLHLPLRSVGVQFSTVMYSGCKCRLVLKTKLSQFAREILWESHYLLWQW